ncbi:MAG: pirin-like C-terminal cupin domain-containing protein [Nocardioides sp.]
MPTYSPTVGAEAVLEAGTTIRPELRGGYEGGVLVDFGLVAVNGQEVKPHELAFVDSADGLEITAYDGSRVLILGGAPFDEEIIMWWNFVGRTHEDIEEARGAWQAQLAADGRGIRDGRFGIVEGDRGPIPAPELPRLRLKPRR